MGKGKIDLKSLCRKIKIYTTQHKHKSRNFQNFTRKRLLRDIH